MSCVPRVILDVGGVQFATSRDTLLSCGSEFFQTLLNNEEDIYFIDRDPQSFSIILNYLRQNKALNYALHEQAAIDFLLAEASYYKMPELQAHLLQLRMRFVEARDPMLDIATELRAISHNYSSSTNNHTKGTGARKAATERMHDRHGKQRQAA